MSGFDTLAASGEQLLRQSQFAQAALLWGAAADASFDEMERARARREQGASLWSMGQQAILGGDTFGTQVIGAQALELVESALSTHQQAVDRNPEAPELLQQRAYTRDVAGTIALTAVIDKERAGRLRQRAVREEGEEALGLLEKAHEDALWARGNVGLMGLRGPRRSYYLSLMTRVGIARSLYGDWQKAKHELGDALAIGVHAEVRSIQLPGQRRLPYVNREGAALLLQGMGGMAANTLALSPSDRSRRHALRLTRLIFSRAIQGRGPNRRD